MRKLKERPTKAAKDLDTITLLNDSVDFLEAQLPLKERIAIGKAMREDCPRNIHGSWKPKKNSRDPIALLASQDATRVERFIPLRYGRMMESPFSFYRGAALIMAHDLSTVPRTRLVAQLCGDCHLSNFGIFATPERNVIFDLNDFDETLPGPIEWDLKRLAASFAVAAFNSSFNKSVAERCVQTLSKVYRTKMEQFAHMKTLDVWYHSVDFEYLVDNIKKPGRKQTVIDKLAKLKDKKTHAGALAKMTEIKDGKRRIKDDPPLIFHPEKIASAENVMTVFRNYTKTLWQSRRRLLQRYHFTDLAAKVVGVGSVGTAAFVLALQGDGGEDDYIFLQAKEASRSVLEPYLGTSEFQHSGERIVNGQRVLQAASDLFLGWSTGIDYKRPFYIRQLMDSKASVPVDELDAVTLEQYAECCAYALARAHARTGDPAIIHGYLGKGGSFDEALCQFALSYAEQNEQDYLVLMNAINKGKIQATPGI